ncbi:MAG: hypothetical protein WCB85_14105 [Candidatus Dormiibacterota bacterium]
MKQRITVAVVANVLIAVGAAGGYLLGTRQPDVTVLTGIFYLGDQEAVGQVDCWWYVMEANVDEWQDAAGTWHQRG